MTATETLTTSARNAGLMDLSAILRTQQDAKRDVVASATALSMRGGLLRVGRGADRMVVRPTAVMDEGLADKMGVPLAYVRRLRAERPDLLDANVNGWLRGWEGGRYRRNAEPVAEPDRRNFLVRTFAGEPEGYGRAFLSDGFRIVDHLDVLTAALEGVRGAGVAVEVDRCDLSERRMQVRLVCPEIEALAPVLLQGYRSPFDHGAERLTAWGDETRAAAHGWLRPQDRPVVFAGLVIRNSETGGGAYTLAPSLTVLACTNGLTFTGEALRAVHLGARMDEGLIQWSAETQEANVDLVRRMTVDAVRTFLTPEYVIRKVAEMEEQAGAPVRDPEATVRAVTKGLRLSEERTIDVLTHFILGGQMTAGGVMQAVTSVAQTVADPDEAADLEDMGPRALALAAEVAR
jgi:hypothetical protein